MDLFQDKDRSYQYWKTENQTGNVLVCIEEPPDGPSLVMHRTDCALLTDLDQQGRDHPGRLRTRRACSRTRDEIESWSARYYGYIMTRCALCLNPPANPSVGNDDLDYDEIVRRGGANGGSENFTIVSCPTCNDIYLADARTGTLYIDASDLSRRRSLIGDTMDCLECGGRMLVVDILKAVRGEASHASWRTGWKTFRESPWAWAAGRDAEGPARR